MQYVFVLGTGRCGSTLVQEVLAKHPEAGFVTNIQDRFPKAGGGKLLAELYRRVPPEVSTKGRVRLAPTEGYRALEEQVSHALSVPSRDLLGEDATPWLAERTRAYFDLHAQGHGRPVFLHKFTGWPRSGFLSAIWPEAKFIHIVRDGRAVANSWLQMPWWLGYSGRSNFGRLPAAYQTLWEQHRRSFPVLAALEWRMLTDAFVDARTRAADGTWLELRYEDVVADARGTFSTMLDFCGLDWSPEFERGFSQFSFRAGRTDAFRRDLGAADVEGMTSALEARLTAFGYPLVEPATP